MSVFTKSKTHICIIKPVSWYFKY